MAIVANETYIFGNKNFKNVNDWIMAAIAAGLFPTKLHPVLVLLIASLLGIVLTKKDFDSTGKLSKARTFRFFLITLLVLSVS